MDPPQKARRTRRDELPIVSIKRRPNSVRCVAVNSVTLMRLRFSGIRLARAELALSKAKRLPGNIPGDITPKHLGPSHLAELGRLAPANAQNGCQARSPASPGAPGVISTRNTSSRWAGSGEDARRRSRE
jgi:hypothetical protein